MPQYPTRALSTRDQAFVAALRRRPDDPRYARLADRLDPPATKPKPTPKAHAETEPEPVKSEPVKPAPPPEPEPVKPEPVAESHAVGGMSTADVKPVAKPTPQPKGR
jgi:hypothetical protein